MTLIHYAAGMSRWEIDVLENIWRSRVNESIRQTVNSLANTLCLNTVIPHELWMCILDIVYPAVHLVCDIRPCTPLSSPPLTQTYTIQYTRPEAV